MIQKKLDVLNKAGLSKDNFLEADSRSIQHKSKLANGIDGQSKITSFLSPSKTSKKEEEGVENDLLADVNWDEEFDFGDDFVMS